MAWGEGRLCVGCALWITAQAGMTGSGWVCEDVFNGRFDSAHWGQDSRFGTDGLGVKVRSLLEFLQKRITQNSLQKEKSFIKEKVV